MHHTLRVSAAIVFAALVSVAVRPSPARAADEAFTLKDQPGQYLDVAYGGKLIARYMYAYDKSTGQRRTETYKPYLHIFDAAGQQPITKGPGGTYPHHRGIFVGWMRIMLNDKKYDRWGMGGGEQVHEKFLAQSADQKQASFTAQIRWTGDGATTLLEEQRTMTFLPPPTPAYVMVDVTSRLKAVAGETRLEADPEHGGLQFRPSEEVDRKQTRYLYPKADANPHKDRDYPWVGETFVLRDQPYSVVDLNHPSNPKDTAFSAYRDYGRFGGYCKVTLPKDGELTLRYRFLVVQGEMPAAEWIQKAYNAYAGTNEPVPPITAKPAEMSAPPKPKTPAPPKAK